MSDDLRDWEMFKYYLIMSQCVFSPFFYEGLLDLKKNTQSTVFSLYRLLKQNLKLSSEIVPDSSNRCYKNRGVYTEISKALQSATELRSTHLRLCSRVILYIFIRLWRVRVPLRRGLTASTAHIRKIHQWPGSDELISRLRAAAS